MKKIFKYTLVISLFSSVYFTSQAQAPECKTETVVVNPAATPIAYLYNDTTIKWKRPLVVELDEKLRTLEDPSKIKVLFIGNSITHGWLGKSGDLWKKRFGDPESPYYALNIGIPGDRTENLLYRLKANADGGMGNLDDNRINPKVVVLMIGTNNYFNHTKEQLIPAVEAVVNRLKTLRPDAHIVLCSILPNIDKEMNYDANIVVPTNAASRILAEKEPQVTYLDLYNKFVDKDGELRKELYNGRDFIHPRAPGYQVWFDQLQPVLDHQLRLK